MATQSAQSNDWTKSPQEYWDMWLDQQRAFLKSPWTGAAADSGAWGQFFEIWRNALSGDTPASSAEAFRHFFASAGAGYTDMMQKFAQPAEAGKTFEQMAQEWAASLQKFFSLPQNEKNPFYAYDPAGFVSSMPGVGYFREQQDQMNELFRLWREYEAKSNAYTAAMSKTGMEAAQKFQEYLSHPPENAEPLKSVREIYGKWVDVCEEIYARYAMSEEYTQLYGETVNALMAFRKEQNKLLDDVIGRFNLPTRQEIDSLHERLHALRRENQQLRKDVDALKRGKAAPPPAAAKKPAAKRKK